MELSTVDNKPNEVNCTRYNLKYQNSSGDSLSETAQWGAPLRTKRAFYLFALTVPMCWESTYSEKGAKKDPQNRVLRNTTIPSFYSVDTTKWRSLEL